MNQLERLALAALVHDLPALFAEAKVPVSAYAQRVLNFALLPDPALGAIMEQAEAYAMPADSQCSLVCHQSLQSIFSLLQIHDSQKLVPVYHQFAALPATTAALDALFPASQDVAEEYHTHLRTFATCLDWLGRCVDLSNFKQTYSHLLATLQRYSWCLPAHSRDTTIFDHARLTSAIAVCLYHYHQADLSVAAIHAATNDRRCCVLVGDLSGIQDYIFDITTIGASGVARRLRARSFYLSVLADVLGHQIARAFDVPLGNVIMASGGKFYLLLPRRADLADQIQTLRARIDCWLHEQFNGEIGINLASIDVSGDLFQAANQRQTGFGDVVTALSEQMDREKQRRGQSILAPDQQWDENMFVMRERCFDGAGICLSCRKFPATQATSLCPQCEHDVTLGKRLPRARYIAYYEHDMPPDAIPLPFDCGFSVLAHGELSGVEHPYLVVKLNDPDITELATLPGSFRYLANHVPLSPHGLQLSFEEIAEQAQGRPLLGYLKADVDYLGLLFAQGLRRDTCGYDTVAHIVALSRQLDLFFSAWVQHVLSQTPAYQGFYTIFSGGDDLFLVGPWDQAANLALTIHERFTDFVGHNSALSLSAGILFTRERYPIARAAQDANDTLKHSKERKDAQGRNRNQLTVFDDTFRWEDAPEIFARVAQLTRHAPHLTSAFLHDLVAYSELYRLWTREGQIEGLRYKPLFAYNIARNLRRGNRDLYQWADELMQSLHNRSESLTMRHLGLIATYLLFAKRAHESRG